MKFHHGLKKSLYHFAGYQMLPARKSGRSNGTLLEDQLSCQGTFFSSFEWNGYMISLREKSMFLVRRMKKHFYLLGYEDAKPHRKTSKGVCFSVIKDMKILKYFYSSFISIIFNFLIVLLATVLLHREFTHFPQFCIIFYIPQHRKKLRTNWLSLSEN